MRQRGNAFFPNPPHVIEVKPLDYIHIVVKPLLHDFSVKPDLVVLNLLWVDRFLMHKLRNRFCGFRARPSNVDALILIAQVTMGFWKKRQAISRQNGSDPWGIAFMHFVDA